MCTLCMVAGRVLESVHFVWWQEEYWRVYTLYGGRKSNAECTLCMVVGRVMQSVHFVWWPE